MMSMLLTLLTLATVALSDQIWTDGFSCAQWLSSAVNKGATQLYIDGGEYYTGTTAANDSSITQSPTTLVIDLTQSWTSSTISKSRVIQAQKPLGIYPLSRRPVVWYSGKTNMLYAWAGWGYGSAQQGLWQLALSPAGLPKSMWTSGPVPNSAIYATWASAYAELNGNMYSLGGIAPLDYWSATPGVVEFNEVAGSWSNSSIAPATASEAFGQATAIASFGTQGVIIYIGGDALQSDPEFSDYSSPPLLGMTSVYIFDVGTKTFYTQQVDGDIPRSRWGHCTTSVTNDDGTVDIFMFGGGATGVDFNGQNVYVLSIPAFTWTELQGTSVHARFNPTCQVIGKRQMVVVGGWGASGDIADQDQRQDPWANGIGIFDLTALKWSQSYDAGAAAYVRSLALSKAVGNRTSPSSWSEGTLASIFTVTPVSSTSTPAPAPNNDSAIIGGAVGGVVALLIILGIIAFFLIRRRRRRSRDSQTYEAVSAELPNNQAPLRHAQEVKQPLPAQHAPVELPARSEPAWEMEESSPSVEMTGSQPGTMSENTTGSDYRPYRRDV